MATESTPFAAVVHTDDAGRHTDDAGRHGDVSDALVQAFCAELRGQGVRVGGITQRRQAVPGQRKSQVQLVDVCTGQAITISQHLGNLSQACCIDPGRVADASAMLRQALHDRVQLAVANRFGELEAAGGGFAAELAALANEGIPVLTIVASKHLASWRQFTGGLGEELPADMPSLRGWFTRTAALRTPA